MWQPWSHVGYWTEISTTSLVQKLEEDIFEVPSTVMQTAVTPTNSSESLQLYWEVDPLAKTPGYLLNLHFSELVKLAKNAKREFNITMDNAMFYNESYSPSYLYSEACYSSKPIRGSSPRHNISLIATVNSTLPPILNAVELFIVLPISDVPTDSADGELLAFCSIRFLFVDRPIE